MTAKTKLMSLALAAVCLLCLGTAQARADYIICGPPAHVCRPVPVCPPVVYVPPMRVYAPPVPVYTNPVPVYGPPLRVPAPSSHTRRSISHVRIRSHSSSSSWFGLPGF